MPLGARSALLDAGHLDHVEEDGADSVGRVTVDALQTPSQLRVTVTVGPVNIVPTYHHHHHQPSNKTLNTSAVTNCRQRSVVALLNGLSYILVRT